MPADPRPGLIAIGPAVKADVQMSADANPDGGDPVVVGVNLRGGLAKAEASGLVGEDPSLPAAYTVSDWGEFKPLVEFKPLG